VHTVNADQQHVLDAVADIVGVRRRTRRDR